jgi:hypothetical protein
LRSSGTITGSERPGGRFPARAAVPMRRPAVHRRTDAMGLTDIVIVGLMLIVVVSLFTLSSAILTSLKIHYLTTGGGFYEKVHPATYLVVLVAFLQLMRNGTPVTEIDRAFSDAKLLLVYLFSWAALLAQMFILDRPFTIIIDTFLLPLLLCLVIWRLTDRQRRPLIWAIHATILLNIAIGYYEFVSGHRLIPLTLGDVTVMGEWRASALLGHPLTASGVVAAYILALLLRPALCPLLPLRAGLIVISLGSLMAFGGRTALMTVLVVLASVTVLGATRIIRGSRTSLPIIIISMLLLFLLIAGIFAAFDLGLFDKMLLRFSSDKGSASARLAILNLLSHFDWNELLLGPNPMRANALQAQLGLDYGVENFWASCIVQFGGLFTALLTIGLVCLFIEILKRSSGAAYAVLLLIMTIAVSSVSFSSKNIQLAQLVILILLLLPRERRHTAGHADRTPHAAYRPVRT